MSDNEFGGNSSGHLTLLTDLYQLTMAQGYFEEGILDEKACFCMFFRDNPFGGGYTVAAGMEQVADYIEGFSFDDSDIAYLASLPSPGGGRLFKEPFLDYLSSMSLSIDVDAVLEGDLIFPREPIVRVIGPIIDCQLVETALLNCVNFQSLIATKSSRICNEAGGGVAEFGLRRAQGPDGGNSAARAAIIGGCDSTSNVLAGKLYDIPVSGTHAHSWVMAFPSELEAFRAFARTCPTNCVLLVDTYDVEEGVKNAITVAQEMEERGEHLNGIRIDSGDLAWLSHRARKMLDAAGFPNVKIIASNDLDEYTISSLKAQGAPIDGWGVGTRLATAYDQAALGGVYKLSAVMDMKTGDWLPRLKATESVTKTTLPGILAARRYYRADGTLCGDLIYDQSSYDGSSELIIDPLDVTRQKDLTGRRYTELLQPLARGGKIVRDKEPVWDMRQRLKDELALLDPSIKRLLNPHNLPVGLESSLYKKREEMLFELKGIERNS